MSNVNNIDAKQLKEWLQSGEAVLVDVREPNEFNEWRIPHSRFMPLTNLDKNLPHLQGETRKIVFQCLAGKRGEMAAEAAMAALPNADIYNLTGGIQAWDEAGFEIIRDAEGQKGMPIMRQVLTAAGSLNILFSLIGFNSQFGTVMTLLLGCGLLFAGVTGKCGMAAFLQKMPWNKK